MDKAELISLSKEHPIVFFDGVCGLCNHFVSWLVNHDPGARFRFSPLQGQAAPLFLDPQDLARLDSVTVLKNGNVFKQSTAVIEILLELSPGWKRLARLLGLVPRVLRDGAYGVVSTTRYKVWGKKEVCRIPSLEERSRFID